MQKKESNNYYIAAVYYIIGVLFIPLLVNLAIMMLVSAMIGESDRLVTTISVYVFSFLSLWVGIMLAAKYINKTYIINNKNDVVKLIARYTLFIDGGLGLIGLFESKNIMELVFGLIFIIIFISLVSFWSKMYIKTDNVIEHTENSVA